jgi:hypothetical protein
VSRYRDVMKEFDFINLHFHTKINFIFYVKNYVLLMTKNRETSNKEAGNAGTFQMHEYSIFGLCSISCVHMNCNCYMYICYTAQVNACYALNCSYHTPGH